MVTVVQLYPGKSAARASDVVEPLAAGLPAAEREVVARALEFAEPLYAGELLSTGEPVWPHALGLASSLAEIGLDAPGRAAGILFAAPKRLGASDQLKEAFGAEIAALAEGVEKLYQLRIATRANPTEQTEVLRKMVLGMVEDVRVVLIRLASRTQTLRWFAKNPSPARNEYAKETLDIYSPLANRLGVWQLKWELEDLSFRYLEPELYKRIAQMLDESAWSASNTSPTRSRPWPGSSRRRAWRARSAAGPSTSTPSGTRCATRALDFVAGLRRARPARDRSRDQGLLHRARRGAQPVAADPQGVRRLHLASERATCTSRCTRRWSARASKTLEVQIRTEEMHRHAEYGVAAHWQYKEKAKTSKAIRTEDRVAARAARVARRGRRLVQGARQARLDDTVYVLTPQGKVIDLPAGATPVDFAYALHTDLGHRCRGAQGRRPDRAARHAAYERAAGRDRDSEDQAGRRATG